MRGMIVGMLAVAWAGCGEAKEAPGPAPASTPTAAPSTRAEAPAPAPAPPPTPPPTPTPAPVAAAPVADAAPAAPAGPPDLAALSKQVAAFAADDASLAAHFPGDGKKVKLVVEGEVEKSFATHADYAAWLAKARKKNDPELMVGPNMTCKKACCAFDREEPPGHRTLYLDEICWTVAENKAVLAKLVFSDFRQDEVREIDR